MQTHFLKTDNSDFESTWWGLKTFEIRKNDRDFKIGDTLILIDYMTGWDDPFSGRLLACSVRHITMGDQLGLDKDFVVMSIFVKERGKSTSY